MTTAYLLALLGMYHDQSLYLPRVRAFVMALRPEGLESAPQRRP